MTVRIIRKLFIVLILIIPFFASTDCKKQAKCGCDGDILFTLTKQPAKVYFSESGTSIKFVTPDNPYNTYNFCNPGEMFPKLTDAKSGDLLLVSGYAYWECNYLYQSSNYSYQTYSKVYVVQVTDVVSDLYSKK